MKRIVKKASLLNTLCNSLVVIMLIEDKNGDVTTYKTDTRTFDLSTGNEDCVSIKEYTKYSAAAKKYAKLVSTLY